MRSTLSFQRRPERKLQEQYGTQPPYTRCQHVTNMVTKKNAPALIDRLIPKEELSQRIGFTPRTILRWVKEGIIPYIRIKNRFLLFDWKKVVQALVKHHGHGFDADPKRENFPRTAACRSRGKTNKQTKEPNDPKST